MKKTYQNPEMRVIMVQTQQLLEASAGFSSAPLDGSKAASRRGRNVWDDEEEFDDEEF